MSIRRYITCLANGNNNPLIRATVSGFSSHASCVWSSPPYGYGYGLTDRRQHRETSIPCDLGCSSGPTQFWSLPHRAWRVAFTSNYSLSALQAARLLWTAASKHPSDFGKISLGTWHDSHRDPRGFDETLVRPHHDSLLLCKSLQHRAWRVGVVKDSGTGRGAALVALLPRGREGSRATSF